MDYSATTHQRSYSPYAPDSYDSYAGTYLLAASWYAKLSGKNLSDEVIQACLSSLATLKQCLGTGSNKNGVFWNFPPSNPPAGVTPGQYLADNVEAYQGISAAQIMFRQAGQPAAAATCQTIALAQADTMCHFWSPKYFSFATLFGDVAAGVPFDSQPVSAAGLSTMFAIAFFDNVRSSTRKSLWELLQKDYGAALQKGYENTDFVLEDPSIELAYLAVNRADSIQNSIYLETLRSRIDTFSERISLISNPGDVGLTYPQVHRFGLMIVSLLSQLSTRIGQLPTVPLNPACAP